MRIVTFVNVKLNQSPDSDSPPPSNIFGWRISFIGLAVIVLLGALAAYRHYTLEVPVGFDDPLTMPQQRDYYHEKADREAAEADSLRKARSQ